MDKDWVPRTFWIVENGVLVRYRREGECNQCGECCRGYRITYTVSVSFGHDDDDCGTDDTWKEWEGYSVFYAQGIWWFLKTLKIEYEEGVECPLLTHQGLCSEWKDPKDFKPICRYWPYHPADLEHFPECGFSFIKEEVRRDIP